MLLAGCIVITSIVLRLPLKRELLVRAHRRFVALVTFIIKDFQKPANGFLRIQIPIVDTSLRLGYSDIGIPLANIVAML